MAENRKQVEVAKCLSLPLKEWDLRNDTHEYPDVYIKPKRLLTCKTVIVILLLLILLSSAVFMYFLYTRQRYDNSPLCKTHECLRSAANLALSMDKNVKPCDNFYQYACGNWAENHPQLNTYNTHNWFHDKQLSVYKEIRNFLSKNLTDQPKPVQQAKDMYTACTNTRLINQIGYKPLLEVLQSVGLNGYPYYLKNYKDPKKPYTFDWVRTVARIKSKIGIDVLIGMEICSELKNSSINRLVLASPVTKNPFISELVKHTPNSRFMNIQGFQSFVNSGPSKKERSDATNTLNTLYSGIMKTLYLAVAENKTESDLDNITLSAAIKYQAINNYFCELENTKDLEEDDDMLAVIPEYTVDQLEAHTDEVVTNNNATPKPIWKIYLEEVIKGSEVSLNYDTDKIMMKDCDLNYLSSMATHIASLPPKLVELYIWIKVVEVLAPQTTTEFRDMFQLTYNSINYKMSELGVFPRSIQCAITVSEMLDMPVAFGIMDVRDLSHTKPKVVQMIHDLKKSLSQLVSHAQWMDIITKQASYEKINEMKLRIAYPDSLLNKNDLEEYYKGLEIDRDSHLQNIVNAARYKVRRDINSLRNKSKVIWEKNPSEVNAFHTFEENTITVPLVMMQYPFFNLGLDSLNYGALGFILGHELTHGLDNLGQYFDKNGNLRPWWSNQTINSFETMTNCFKNQYSSYYLKQVDCYVDGNKTLSENLADNGGLREAYMALQFHLTKAEPELKLPGFEKFTSEQLFFLSFGNVWCNAATEESMMDDLEDVHSPLEVRVIRVLQNSEAFANAWNCKPGSYMNPDDKCVIY